MPLGGVQMSMGSLLQKLRSWCHLEALSPSWCSVTNSATLNYSTTLQALTPKDAKRCGVSLVPRLSPCPDESGEPRNEASGESFCYHQKFHCTPNCTTQDHAHVSVTELLLLFIFFRWGIRRSIWDEGTVRMAVGGGARTNYTIMSNHCFLLFFFYNWTIAPLTWTSFRSSRLRYLSNIAFSLDKVSFNFLKERDNQDKSVTITRLYEDSHSVLYSCSCSAESSMVWRASSGKDDSLSCLLIVAMMMIKTVSVTMVTRTCKPSP